MQAIALHDLLEASLASSTTLTADGLTVPAGTDNIVVKAAAVLERAVGRELPTKFHLHKRIPPGAGLGGSSSDAATALKALVTLHGLDVDISEIAPAIGADVPFFVKGGRALAGGTGDRIESVQASLEWYAIAWPGIELSTAAVYGAWDDTGGEPPNELRRAAEGADGRLREFAARLGSGWQMTGSGSAFFIRCAGRSEGLKAIATLDCWTTVTHGVEAWG